jgi:hypothetical protein
LYRPDAIQLAVAAYEGLATFQVESGEHETRVTIVSPRPDLAHRLADALANHVLHETVRGHRARP